MERLRHIGRGLIVAGPPLLVTLPTAGDDAAQAQQALQPLRQHEDGSVLDDDLAWLQSQEQAAAQRQDYRQAQLLHDLRQALGPKPQLALEDCAPAGVDAQLEFFLQNGFCVLHNVLTAEQLPRARAAWMAAEEEAAAAWWENKDDRTFFDIRNLLALDDVFIDMVDSPAVVPLLSRITGDYRALEPDRLLSSSGSNGCMWVGGMGGRIVPSEGNADGCEFPASNLPLLVIYGCDPESLLVKTDTRWHRDKPSSYATDNPSYRHVKVFTNLWDIPTNGGATSYVPGTHRLPLGPEGHLERGLFARAGDGEGKLDQRLMPNFIEAALPAGSAIAFDSSGWHTSMPNTSSQPRRSCYSLYRSSENRGSLTEGRNPTWPELGETRAGIPEAMLRRLDSEGKLGVQRRRILGLPDTGTGSA